MSLVLRNGSERNISRKISNKADSWLICVSPFRSPSRRWWAKSLRPGRTPRTKKKKKSRTCPSTPSALCTCGRPTWQSTSIPTPTPIRKPAAATRRSATTPSTTKTPVRTGRSSFWRHKSARSGRPVWTTRPADRYANASPEDRALRPETTDIKQKSSCRWSKWICSCDSAICIGSFAPKRPVIWSKKASSEAK